ncbi:protein of unknown function [Burkholderia multivorans]
MPQTAATHVEHPRHSPFDRPCLRSPERPAARSRETRSGPPRHRPSRHANKHNDWLCFTSKNVNLLRFP